MMSFGMTAFLSIFLHMAPTTAGALWSIYQNDGVTVNNEHSDPRASGPRKKTVAITNTAKMGVRHR